MASERSDGKRAMARLLSKRRDGVMMEEEEEEEFKFIV
jgi:hypothetical protein